MTKEEMEKLGEAAESLKEVAEKAADSAEQLNDEERHWLKQKIPIVENLEWDTESKSPIPEPYPQDPESNVQTWARNQPRYKDNREVCSARYCENWASECDKHE